MSRRHNDLRHYSSKQHIDGSADHTNTNDSMSSSKKEKTGRGSIFSRMFGQNNNTSESNAEHNYRRKIDSVEELQQQHPYYHDTSTSIVNREREHERRERDSREKDGRDKEHNKDRDREREHRAERERDKEKDKDRDREKSSKHREKNRDSDRDKDERSTASRSSKHRGDGSKSRDVERVKDRERDRFNSSPTKVDHKKRPHSTTLTSSKPLLISSDDIKLKSATMGSYENAYVSSLLNSSSGGKSHRPSGVVTESSSSASAVTKSGSGGGVSAGGSSSQLHDNSNYDYGTQSSMMHLSSSNGITTAHQSYFSEMNRMFEITGIKFDRTGVTAGEAIASLGDQHLARLEEQCKKSLASIVASKKNDTESLGNGLGHTEVALVYTEVLQLQGRPQEAVLVLSKAIEILNNDLSEAKKIRSKKDSHGDSMSMASGKSSNPLDFDHLKKMKALCHRRIGSLYKLTNRLKDAEEHIKRYISIIERTTSSDVMRRESSMAFALLTSIYEAMGKTAEAQAADKTAIELAAAIGRGVGDGH